MFQKNHNASVCWTQTNKFNGNPQQTHLQHWWAPGRKNQLVREAGMKASNTHAITNLGYVRIIALVTQQHGAFWVGGLAQAIYIGLWTMASEIQHLHTALYNGWKDSNIWWVKTSLASQFCEFYISVKPPTPRCFFKVFLVDKYITPGRISCIHSFQCVHGRPVITLQKIFNLVMQEATWYMSNERDKTTVLIGCPSGRIVAIILIIINDPATHCLSKQSMYSRQTIVLCTESGLPVQRQTLWTVHLLKVASFSTCQRKTTVHRIGQQVLSHWVKWSNSPNSSHTSMPACCRVT